MKFGYWNSPMAERSKDWFVQAERDLEQAKSSQKEGRHEWACFAAQQSAEKAVKMLKSEAIWTFSKQT